MNFFWSNVPSVKKYVSKGTVRSMPTVHVLPCPDLTNLRNSVLNGVKHLVMAHRYARSGKTLLQLESAYKSLLEVLDDANTKLVSRQLVYSDNDRVSPNISIEPKAQEVEICPETWKKATFEVMWFEMNCTGYKPKPFGSLVTLHLNLVNEAKLADLSYLITGILMAKSIYNNYWNIPIVVATTDAELVKKTLKETKLKFSVVHIRNETSRGSIIRQMIQK